MLKEVLDIIKNWISGQKPVPIPIPVRSDRSEKRSSDAPFWNNGRGAC